MCVLMFLCVVLKIVLHSNVFFAGCIACFFFLQDALLGTIHDTQSIDLLVHVCVCVYESERGVRGVL